MAHPKRQRKMKNALKNAELGTEEFAKKVLHWHKEVAKDFEREFGSEVFMFVSNALYIKTGEKEGQGTLSWIGNNPNTVNMIGHLIRQMAKDGVVKGGMSPAASGQSLVAAILEVAALDALEQYVSETPVGDTEEVTPKGPGIYLPPKP